MYVEASRANAATQQLLSLCDPVHLTPAKTHLGMNDPDLHQHL
jgi:hypothetical protein